MKNEDFVFYLHFTQLNKAPLSWVWSLSSRQKPAPTLKAWTWANNWTYIQTPWEFGKTENTVKLSTDFNVISVKTFSALQHIHLHVNAPVWQRLMRRDRSFQSWLQLRFQSGNKSGLHFPWFLKRLLHLSKPVTFKKVGTSRSDSVPYNNGTCYWLCEVFLCLFFFLFLLLFI